MLRNSITLPMLAPALLLGLLLAAPAGAVSVSADTIGGYGAQVMDIIIANWVRPPGAAGSTSVIVRITTDGRPFSCELRKGSGNPMVDDAICLAVAKAGIFPPAPYGAPAEVALTFMYDTGAPPPPLDAPPPPVVNYPDQLVENARQHLEIPETATGDLSATVRLLILQDGTMGEYRMEQPSGNPEFDTAVLRALLYPGVIFPPPDGQEQTVYLTFSNQ